MIKKKFNRTLAVILSAILTVSTGIPSVSAVYENTYPDGIDCVLVSDDNAVFNVEKADVDGSIYAHDDIIFYGSETMKINGSANAHGSVSENISFSETDSTAYQIPDFSDSIEHNVNYSKHFQEDIEISETQLSVSENFLIDGNFTLDEVTLNGMGYITAENNITLNSIKNNCEYLVLYSKDGNIIINGSKLTIDGIIYAPKGKVIFNVKNLTVNGGIYAEDVEFNGTELYLNKVDNYDDLVREQLKVDAGADREIYVGENLLFEGSANYENVSYQWSGDKSIVFENENSQSTSAEFTKTGTYTVTLTGRLHNLSDSDTLSVKVNPDPSRTFTSDSDFNSGNSSDIAVKNDSIMLEKDKKNVSEIKKSYTSDGVSGVNIDSTVSKDKITSSSESIDISYDLKGVRNSVTTEGIDFVFVIDNSGSMWGEYLRNAQEAAKTILGYMHEGDRYAIADLGRVHIGFTDDKELIEQEINRVGSGSGSSEADDGVDIANKLFDEQSSPERQKYIILLADGETDKYSMETMRQYARDAAERNIKIFSLAMRNDIQNMQEAAIITNGIYKNAPDGETIKKFMEIFGNNIFNFAARNVLFKTTVSDKSKIDFENISPAPSAVKDNKDGSTEITWNLDTFEADEIKSINIPVKSDMFKESGYEYLTSNTALYYNDKEGKGQKIYLDDITLPCDTFKDSGTWSAVYDSERENCEWTGIYWHSVYPSDSSADMYISVSNDGVNYTEEMKVNNYTVPENLKGRYIRVKTELHKASDGSSPVVEDITVISGTMKLTKPVDTTISTNIIIKPEIYKNRPVTLYADIQSNSDSVKEISWTVAGNENYVLDTAEILKPTVIFGEKGDYQITLKVADDNGNIAEKTVNISVKDEENVSDIVFDDSTQTVKYTVEGAEFEYFNNKTTVDKNIHLVTDNPSAISWVSVRVVPDDIERYKGRWNDVFVYHIDEDLNSAFRLPYCSGKLEITAYDWSGTPYTYTFDILYDDVRPTVSVEKNEKIYSRGYFTKDPYTVTVKAEDNGEIDHVELYLGDEMVSLDENNSHTFVFTESGSYRFRANAFDKAGNSSYNIFYEYIYDDTTLPGIYPFSLNRRNASIGNEIVFTAKAYDNETGVKSAKYTVNDEEITLDENGEYKYIADKAGEFIFKGVAVDYRDNTFENSMKLTVTEDTQAPGVSISATRSREILVNTSAVVTVTANDNVAVTQIDVDVNGKEYTLDENNQFVFTPEEAGDFIITAVAYDNAGNSRSLTYKLKAIDEDITPPSVSYYSANRYEYYNGSQTISVNSGDNTKVDTREFFIDGKPIEKANNGYATPEYSYTDHYQFNPYNVGIGEHTFKAVTTDSSGNKTELERAFTVSDTTAPNISFEGVSTFNTNDTVTVTLKITDFSDVDSVTGTLNGENIVLKNTDEQTLTIENAPAGNYTYSVTAKDIYGNERTNTRNITVRDTVKPVITVSDVEEEYFIPNKPVIKMTVTDNMEVSTVSVTMNGSELVYDGKNIILPEILSAGDYTINITASDTSRNYSYATVKFKVSKPKDITPPVIESVKLIPDNPEVGKPIKVYVTASDDSGTAEIEVTTDGQKFTYENGAYIYTPTKTGEIAVTISATDPSGNVSAITATGYVSSDSTAPIVNADYLSSMTAGHSQTITISAEDEKGIASISLQMNGNPVTLSNGKYVFTPSKTGDYQFTASANDMSGNTGTKEFVISVSEKTDEKELQKYLVNEAETAMTQDMKDRAKELQTAVNVYDFVKNTIRTEYYTGSRKGAAAVYEQLGGNDVDISSLMIAMLRYLKYPSRYVSGTVQYTDNELLKLTGADNVAAAIDCINASGYDSQTYYTPSGQKLIRIEHTWVEVYAPLSECGIDSAEKSWITLDGWFKNYTFNEIETENVEHKYSAALSSELLKRWEEVENKYNLDFSKIKAVLNDNINNHQTATGYYKIIDGAKIEKLPSVADFNIISKSEYYSSVSDSKCDKISVSMDGKTIASFKTNELFGKRLLIQYKPANEKDKALFTQNNENWKNMSCSSMSVIPVITVDGKVVGSGTETTLGQIQNITILSECSGKKQSYRDELVAGSMYALVVNTYDIAARDLTKSYNYMYYNALSDKTYGAYSEEYLGALLDFAGKLYFSMNDTIEFFNSANCRVNQNPDTAIGIFGYEFETTLNGWTGQVTGNLKDGTFMTDIDCLRSTPVSLIGSEEDRRNFVMSSGIVSSLCEGYIWEYILGSQGISSVSVIVEALKNNVEVFVINSDNKSYAMSKLSVSDEVRNDISNYIDKGYTVYIPQKQITMGNWTGSGYIMFDFNTMSENIYRLSGGINGGSVSSVYNLSEILESNDIDPYDTIFEEAVQLANRIRVFIAQASLQRAAVSFAATVYGTAVSGMSTAGSYAAGTLTVSDSVFFGLDLSNLALSGNGLVDSLKSGAVSIFNSRQLLLDYYSGNIAAGFAEIKACVCEMEAFAYSVGFGALGDLATGLGVVGTFTDNSRLGNFATVLGYLTNIASSMIPS